MSNFSFLQPEWPAVFEAAGKAEAVVHADPRAACFYARRTLELAIAWVYKHDAALKLPYQSTCCSRKPAGRYGCRDREFEVTGMPNKQGKGFVDYVLWGDDGKPLGLVEAKRTRRDARVGQQQAKLYADCLEQQFGQRPVIFYSNGYEHWLWDDANYPPRAGAGLLQEGGAGAADPAAQHAASPWRTPRSTPPIVERYYQTRGIRRIGEAFETRPRPQGAAGDGHRRRQDAHGDRAGRPADALQLGQAGPVPGRPRGAGQPGGQRVQETPARLVAGQSGHREGRARGASSSPPIRR